MDLESPWSDFYDLLLQDEASQSETEDEWTSVQKTARGQIECRSMSTTMDDTTPMDPEFQTFVNQVLATVSSSSNSKNHSSPAQRHYHFHHHQHRLDTAASSWNWAQPVTNSTDPCSLLSNRKDLALMPGTFIINHEEKDPIQLSKRQCPCAAAANKVSSTQPTATTWLMDVHAWITSIAFVAHLLLLWFRP